MSAGDPLPRLHLVTNDEILRRGDFPPRAEELLEAGGARLALHLRGPSAGGAALYHLAERLAVVAARTGGLLLVNDRVDVALAVNAGGVQLGGRGLDPEDARRVEVTLSGILGSVSSRMVSSASSGQEDDFLDEEMEEDYMPEEYMEDPFMDDAGTDFSSGGAYGADSSFSTEPSSDIVP